MAADGSDQRQLTTAPEQEESPNCSRCPKPAPAGDTAAPATPGPSGAIGLAPATASGRRDAARRPPPAPAHRAAARPAPARHQAGKRPRHAGATLRHAPRAATACPAGSPPTATLPAGTTIVRLWMTRRAARRDCTTRRESGLRIAPRARTRALAHADLPALTDPQRAIRGAAPEPGAQRRDEARGHVAAVAVDQDVADHRGQRSRRQNWPVGSITRTPSTRRDAASLTSARARAPRPRGNAHRRSSPAPPRRTPARRTGRPRDRRSWTTYDTRRPAPAAAAPAGSRR